MKLFSDSILEICLPKDAFSISPKEYHSYTSEPKIFYFPDSSFVYAGLQSGDLGLTRKFVIFSQSSIGDTTTVYVNPKRVPKFENDVCIDLYPTIQRVKNSYDVPFDEYGYYEESWHDSINGKFNKELFYKRNYPEMAWNEPCCNYFVAGYQCSLGSDTTKYERTIRSIKWKRKLYVIETD